MGDAIRLAASDGHAFDAYRAVPKAERKGGLVVIQEIFGINDHIRDVADRFAAAGYEAIAPALFDRVQRKVELDYTPDGIAAGRELAAAIGWDWPVADIAAAAAALGPRGTAGAVGYCWGASWTWVAACRLDLGCAVCYYGRHIVDLLGETPRAPVMMHFGEDDASIPMENVDKIQAAHPDMPIHIYPGVGHGFNCDRRADFGPEQSALALERTLGFFADHLR